MLPRPDGQVWHPHTIHTHYFGFSIPEEALGAFIYLRCQPVFGLCSAGVSIFRGLDNPSPLDFDHVDYVLTLPWPEVAGNTITTANGLRIEFLEPGATVRLSYESADGAVAFDVLQHAVTPLLARGHVMPGEDEATDPAQGPGGSEQFMRCTGTLDLRGERLHVDCHPIRDRSWRQVRTEDEVVFPPVGWSPMWFGDDLAFNQVGFEPIDTDPAWQGLYDVPADRPAHYFGWVYRSGQVRELRRVRRNVIDYHPELYAALRQEIEVEDDTGERYCFTGEALAMGPVPSWPNNAFVDSVYRWEDAAGRVTHCTYQETWFARYHRAMRERRR